MPNIRNIQPEKGVEQGERRAVKPFTRGMEDFFGGRLPRRWMMDLFEPFGWRRPFWNDFDEAYEAFPKVDIIDKKKSLIVKAEMPGVRKEDLDITIAGDRLTIEARRDFEDKEEKDDFVRSEMRYGRLYRVITLPVEVKGDEAEAKMKDGVVEIMLPKVEEVMSHTVKVA